MPIAKSEVYLKGYSLESLRDLELKIHVRSAHYILNTEPERYMSFAMFSMLNTARDNGIRSLALPAIGTGVFKFPPMLAARITAKALREFEKKSDAIDLVRVCVVNEEMRRLYESAVALEDA